MYINFLKVKPVRKSDFFFINNQHFVKEAIFIQFYSASNAVTLNNDYTKG